MKRASLISGRPVSPSGSDRSPKYSANANPAPRPRPSEHGKAHRATVHGRRRTDGDDDEDDEEGHHVRDDLLEHVDQEAEEFEPAQEGDNLPRHRLRGAGREVLHHYCI